MTDLRINPLTMTDSYGKIFLYNTESTVACVPRHTIRMSEPIDPECLLKAVRIALLRFPHMCIGIEKTETSYQCYVNGEDPVVLPFDPAGVEHRYAIGSADTHHYLFLVGYRGNNIYMEYQHSISDGRGFEEFIRCVLFLYLQECGKPVRNDGSIRALDTMYTREESEDAFRALQEMEPKADSIYQKPEAVHAEGLTNLGDVAEVVTDITFPFSELHAVTKKLGVSPLTVLTPVFSRAFYHKYGEGVDKPVISQIPVDLRQVIPSSTTRYFICFLDLPYLSEYESLPLEEACRKTHDFLMTQLVPEQLLYRGKAASEVCLELHEREMPLADKVKEGIEVARNFVLQDSFLVTNVGRFALPDSMLPYVEEYGAILPSAAQTYALLISSYNGTMRVSIAHKDQDFDVCNEMVSLLSELGIHADSRTEPFCVTRYSGELCTEDQIL